MDKELEFSHMYGNCLMKIIHSLQKLTMTNIFEMLDIHNLDIFLGVEDIPHSRSRQIAADNSISQRSILRRESTKNR